MKPYLSSRRRGGLAGKNAETHAKLVIIPVLAIVVAAIFCSTRSVQRAAANDGSNPGPSAIARWSFYLRHELWRADIRTFNEAFSYAFGPEPGQLTNQTLSGGIILATNLAAGDFTTRPAASS